MKLYSHNAGQLVKTYSYEDFCKRIDRWKLFFIELYNARAGQRILFDFTTISVDYFAAIFASAELGLVLVTGLPDSLKNFDIKAFPDIDFDQEKIDYILEFGANTEWNQQRNRILGRHIITTDYWADYSIKNANLLTTAVDENSVLTTTLAGETKTHLEIYKISKRLEKLLAYQDQSILHVTAIQLKDHNLYWNLLAGFMGGSEHFIFNPIDSKDLDYSTGIAKFVNDNKINCVPITVFLPNVALHFMRATEKVTHSLHLTTIGAVNKEILRLLKEKNIASIRCVFNDVGWFVKTFTKDYNVDSFQLTAVGECIDDFYQFEIRDQELYVACPEFKKDFQSTGYKFVKHNNEYHNYGTI